MSNCAEKKLYFTLIVFLLIYTRSESMLYAQNDTTDLQYQINKLHINTFEDLNITSPFNLNYPSNITIKIVYDHITNTYVFQNMIGKTKVGTAFTLTAQEYMNYRLKQSNNAYFKNKNNFRHAAAVSDNVSPFSFQNVRKTNNTFDNIFGPDNIKITTNGFIELSSGLKRTSIDNPALPERARTRNNFDLNPQVQLQMNAKVGSKIDFNLIYNNDATFDFDAKSIKLAYKGDEDEIIKNIEAGNVSMSTSNSLIQGGAALFGIKSELQFGKLHINTILSQQESESRKIHSNGAVRTVPFEIKADQYDENKHFFLSHYFKDNYDHALSKLPLVQSGILITRIEAWVTNKTGQFNQSRNILAFADMAEFSTIFNTLWSPQGSLATPHNEANSLYPQLISNYSAARDLSRAFTILPSEITIGIDYEKIENARLLTPSEYSFQPQLGYISLNSPLQADEVLAVAYEYTYNGKTYQVGEFSNNVGNASNIDSGKQTGALFVKMLKPVSFSPQAYTWHLMMKNIYSIGYNAHAIQKENFNLSILFQSDTTGIYLNYLPVGNIKNELLLRVMNLDRLNNNGDPYPDGIFDFIEGYTIDSQNGRIIFPVIEPFAGHLKKKIGSSALAEPYLYRELYDSTLIVARQYADKNKFKLSGEFKGSSKSSINLDGMNIARGSVRVTAGGVVLTEGVDYSVDYLTGSVTLLNQSLIDAGTPIDIQIENQSLFNTQRKTLMGLNLNYDFSKNFSLGGTLMHYYEKPLLMKQEYGAESVRNTLWGINAKIRRESHVLTNILNLLPFVEVSNPSVFSANLEFAQMIPGLYRNKYTGNYSYIDDFESSASKIDLKSPYGWFLASTPHNTTSSGLFPEAALSNNIEYGKNRAHMAWFFIDGLFTRRNSSRIPAHLKNDKEQLSNHLVREVYEREIYPKKDAVLTEPPIIPVLNISYYPNERGPYNLDTQMNSQGKLLNPRNRWGGIMRKMETRDFEAANIEYIEFWLMDPFVNDSLGIHRGGDLYFNLGEISEDVLKDGKKFYENGLPVNGDPAAVGYSVWGKYPIRQSTVYAFDDSEGIDSRRIQDVGLNGLNTEEEKQYPTYANYLDELKRKLSNETILKMQNDKFSPLNDPAGDNFRHYRGAELDREQLGILDRYKYFNGTEGNSLGSNADENFTAAARTTPDVEDIDSDNTLNENESYYQYKVQLVKDKMEIGKNFITDIKQSTVTLRNGNASTIKWYQFKVPLRDYQSKTGNIQGFNNIRFMRIFLTNFEEPVFLRFATLDLVRGEWRTYTRNPDKNGPNLGTGTVEVTTVNFEENSDRLPVNYILPPGLKRMLDPSQPQLRQQNEQSLALKINNLDIDEARAIYKNTLLDLRRHKKMQLFVHAEALSENTTDLKDGELSIFIRLGSDYLNNYYEYEIPLTLTPPGWYNINDENDREKVWKKDNMFDFSLNVFTNLKLKRNAQKMINTGVNFFTHFSDVDPQNPGNIITIMGNPSLSEIKVMMIGVRNKTRNKKSGEIWINELRLNEYEEQGGWAANGNIDVELSDLGRINLSGRTETAGFGALNQSLLERRNDDFYTLNMMLSLDLGRFIPKQVKLSAPFLYTYNIEHNIPLYNPLDQDIKMSESLKNEFGRHSRDSIAKLAIMQNISKNLSMTNWQINLKSKKPMPYDLANFRLGFVYAHNNFQNPETEYSFNMHQRIQASYIYTPTIQPFEPFKQYDNATGWKKFAKTFSFNYLPNSVQFNTMMARDYRETQLRDLNNYLAGIKTPASHLLTFSQNFLWNRDFSFNWDLTNNLKSSFRSGTISEIEEPYLQVNRQLNRDDYQVWKDSVVQSIRNLGRPLNYDQMAELTYNLPFASIPAMDWMNVSAIYNSHYRWERGAIIPGERLGNNIQNDVSYTINNGLNLIQLYNKIDFLRKANKRFDQQNYTRESISATPRKRFTQKVQLIPDSTIIVTHNLGSKKLIIRTRKNNKSFTLDHTIIDDNSIIIHSKDSVQVDLSVMRIESDESDPVYQIAQYAARGLMMLRSININAGYKARTDISGFDPQAGDYFGQYNSPTGLIPGLGFAFGFEGGVSFLEKADKRQWLVKNPHHLSPAIYNKSRNLIADAELEPIRGFKVIFNVLYENNQRSEIRYMFQNMPSLEGGSFAISTVMLSSAFENSNARNNYHSASFERFLSNRAILAKRFNDTYTNTLYPDKGFISETSLVGRPFNPENGVFDLNAADVMIPSFIAAYTGRKAHNTSLSPFPKLRSMMPNWNVTFDVLSSIQGLENEFKSLMLVHKYISQYRIGAYSSHLDWVSMNDDSDLGYIRNILNGMPLPSSPHNIASVNLIESFNPLIEARGVLQNNFQFSLRVNRMRSVNLITNSFQIVETLDNDLVVGAGYRIMNLNRILGFKKSATSRKLHLRVRDKTKETETKNFVNDFNNDLNIRLDVSHKTTHALIRKIEDESTQPTSGLKTSSVRFSADYALSRSLTLRAFFDKIINKPLISSSSYTTANTNAGISLRIDLNN